MTSPAYCAMHPNQPASATCEQCMRPICAQCTQMVANKPVCVSCVAAIRARVAAEMRPTAQTAQPGAYPQQPANQAPYGAPTGQPIAAQPLHAAPAPLTQPYGAQPTTSPPLNSSLGAPPAPAIGLYDLSSPRDLPAPYPQAPYGQPIAPQAPYGQSSGPQPLTGAPTGPAQYGLPQPYSGNPSHGYSAPGAYAGPSAAPPTSGPYAQPYNAAPVGRPIPVPVYSPEPNIAIGIVFGIIASVIAGVAWVAIASATHLTIGYMALGVGALVGWAVATGVRAPGPTGGIISVILSVLTILGAELLTLNPEHMEGLLFTVLFAFIGARWAYGIGSGSGMARRP